MPTATKTATTKKRARRRERRRPQAQRRPRKKRRALPGWGDLAGEKKEARQEGSFLAGVSTLRFALVVLAVAGTCALYVGHVHATQQLFSQVEHARAEQRRLQLEKMRLENAFDEATAPAVIYRRAEALGLKDGLSRGPVIRVGDASASDASASDASASDASASDASASDASASDASAGGASRN